MTNPIHILAAQLAESDGSGPAETVAREYMRLHRDKELLEARYGELYKRFNNQVHEREMGRSVRQSANGERTRETLEVLCDAPDCQAALTFDFIPPDEAIPIFIMGRNWLVLGDKHYCGGHS